MENNKGQKKRQKRGPTIGLTVRMPAPCVEQLEESAKNANLVKGAHVRKIVLDYLDKEYKNKTPDGQPKLAS